MCKWDWSWRRTLRDSNSTVKQFQQTKLCSGVPKINTEHLYQGKQTLGVVLFLNICCILISESSSLQLRLTLKVSPRLGQCPVVQLVTCLAGMLWLFLLHNAGSPEQAGVAHGTVFVISSLRPPHRAEPGVYSAIPFQGPLPSLCACG